MATDGICSRALIFRREQSASLGNLFKALAAAKLEPKWHSAVKRNAKAQYGAFANMAALLDATEAALAKHSLVVNQTFHWDTELLLVTEVGHGGSGEFIRSILPIPKNGKIQEVKSAITYMRRAGYEALLGLAPTDMSSDDDGDAANRAGGRKGPDRQQWRRTELLATQKIANARSGEELDRLIDRVRQKIAEGELPEDSLERLEQAAAARQEHLNDAAQAADAE